MKQPSQDGGVVAFGANSRQQLGLNDEDDRSLPNLVCTLNPEERISIELLTSDCKLKASQRGLEMKDPRDLKDFDNTR